MNMTENSHGKSMVKRYYHDRSISLKKYADKLPELSQPLFRYFLDGSRHTYKVDDISSEVNRLVKQFEQSKKMMRQMPGLMGGKAGKRGGGFKLPFGL